MIKLAVTLEDGFAFLAYLAIHLSNGEGGRGEWSLRPHEIADDTRRQSGKPRN